MKRFDLQKSGKINYADFFDMIVPFKPELRNKIENKEPEQSSPSKSQEAPNEQVLDGLKNLFDLIIKSEKEINDMRKSFGTLRLNLRDIFGLLDKGGKGYFTVEELVDYLKKNGIKNIMYNSINDLLLSDHKPIVGVFELFLKNPQKIIIDNPYINKSYCTFNYSCPKNYSKLIKFIYKK